MLFIGKEKVLFIGREKILFVGLFVFSLGGRGYILSVNAATWFCMKICWIWIKASQQDCSC